MSPGILDLLGGLGGNLGGLVNPRALPEREPGHRSYLQVTDGDTAYDTEAEVIALITGTPHADFRKIWQKTVEAQRLMAWGYGSAALQHNQGYMWFACLDLAVNFDVGVLRLVQSNSRETKTFVVAEIPDGRLHSVTVTTLATAKLVDINQMIPLPEKVEYPLIGEDSKMILTYALITAATAHETVGFDIPVTIYE